MQAGIGNVAAGSLFAAMQSLTMTGVLINIGTIMVALGAFFIAMMGWEGGKEGGVAN